MLLKTHPNLTMKGRTNAKRKKRRLKLLSSMKLRMPPRNTSSTFFIKQSKIASHQIYNSRIISKIEQN
jgi:hypothetical protein